MVLDYSKWDKLRLSDDSDDEIETSSKAQSSGYTKQDEVESRGVEGQRKDDARNQGGMTSNSRDQGSSKMDFSGRVKQTHKRKEKAKASKSEGEPGNDASKTSSKASTSTSASRDRLELQEQKIEYLKEELVIAGHMRVKLDHFLALLRNNQGSPADVDTTFFEATTAGSEELTSKWLKDADGKPGFGGRLFEKYRLLVLDLCDSVERELEKKSGQMQRGDYLQCHIKAVSEEIEDVISHQIELLDEVASLEDGKDINPAQSFTRKPSYTSYISSHRDEASGYPPQPQHFKISSNSSAERMSNTPNAEANDHPMNSTLGSQSSGRTQQDGNAAQGLESQQKMGMPKEGKNITDHQSQATSRASSSTAFTQGHVRQQDDQHEEELETARVAQATASYINVKLRSLLLTLKEDQRNNKKPRDQAGMFFAAMSDVKDLLNSSSKTSDELKSLRRHAFEGYRQLILSLISSVEKEIHDARGRNQHGRVYEAYINGVAHMYEKHKEHHKDFLTKTARLENRKDVNAIQPGTRDGFDTSGVSTHGGEAAQCPSRAKHTKNPSTTAAAEPFDQADVLKDFQTAEDTKTTSLAERFLQIDEYVDLYHFVVQNPDLLKPWEHRQYIQSEMISALQKQDASYARRCAHHLWVHKACNEIGPNAFFEAMLDPSSEAKRWFLEEVEDVYQETRKRLPTSEGGERGGCASDGIPDDLPSDGDTTDDGSSYPIVRFEGDETPYYEIPGPNGNYEYLPAAGFLYV